MGNKQNEAKKSKRNEKEPKNCLKVVGNENSGGPGRCQMPGF